MMRTFASIKKIETHREDGALAEVRCLSCQHKKSIFDLSLAEDLNKKGYCSNCKGRLIEIIYFCVRQGNFNSQVRVIRDRRTQHEWDFECMPTPHGVDETPEKIKQDVDAILRQLNSAVYVGYDDEPRPEIMTREGVKYMRRNRI